MPNAILDPTGTATTSAAKPAAPRAPRPASLNGKRVGLLINTKLNARPFLEEVGRLLTEQYGVTVTKRTKQNFAVPETEDVIKEMFGGLGGAGRARTFRGGFEPEDTAEPAGRDVTIPVSITLEEAAAGGTRRVRMPTGKEVDVKIPAGIAEGQQVRLKGQGMPGQAGSGDVLITLSIAPHPVFKLEGNDVRLDLPITLYEAALGAKVRVPTLDKPVEITIPPWTSSGRTFRLKGKGFPAKGHHGDLLATVRIALPEKSDPDLEALMKKWQAEKSYDPRTDM